MKRATIMGAALLAAALAARGVAGEVPSATPAGLEAVLGAEAERIAVMDKAKDAVLAVFPPSGSQGGGSGVVISPDGFGLTNFHVAKPCGDSMKCGMADGKIYDAVIVGVDPAGDVALIKLFGRDDFPHAELGDSDQLAPGDWCFAMGNPFLLAADFLPTVTYGVVSGLHRYQYPAGTLLEYTDCIQTDASINPGNSGGPLFDAQGRLIGINGRASFEKRGRVNVGIAYAISINQIKNFLGDLRSGRIVDHATLGATVSNDAAGRPVVDDILEKSDVYRRGLRYDDEIVSFGGRPIATPNGFKNVLGIFPKGWRVPLSFRREGTRRDVLVRLEGLHGEEELLEKAAGRSPMNPMPIPEPGDKPGKEQPGPGDGKPGDGRPKVIPRHHGDDPETKLLPSPPTPMPEIVKKHFEEKRGFANYYFNRLGRDRVCQAWTAKGNFSDTAGTWDVQGKLTGGGVFRLVLSDEGASLEAPNSRYEWLVGDDLAASLAPPESGGLLPALYLWRRLAVEGPERFGHLYYVGTAPLAGLDELADVLAGSYKGVRCRFYFHPDTAVLLALEMYPDEDADPCEVRFGDYRQVDGRTLPGRVESRWGDEVYTVLGISSFISGAPEAQ
jgi:S1-C subfamily serine protease